MHTTWFLLVSRLILGNLEEKVKRLRRKKAPREELDRLNHRINRISDTIDDINRAEVSTDSFSTPPGTACWTLKGIKRARLESKLRGGQDRLMEHAKVKGLVSRYVSEPPHSLLAFAESH